MHSMRRVWKSHSQFRSRYSIPSTSPWAKLPFLAAPDINKLFIMPHILLNFMGEKQCLVFILF